MKTRAIVTLGLTALVACGALAGITSHGGIAFASARDEIARRAQGGVRSGQGTRGARQGQGRAGGPACRGRRRAATAGRELPRAARQQLSARRSLRFRAPGLYGCDDAGSGQRQAAPQPRARADRHRRLGRRAPDARHPQGHHPGQRPWPRHGVGRRSRQRGRTAQRRGARARRRCQDSPEFRAQPRAGRPLAGSPDDGLVRSGAGRSRSAHPAMGRIRPPEIGL